MRVLLALLLMTMALSGCLRDFGQSIGVAPEDPEPWEQPELADALIRPGVAIGQSTCTSNFLFLDDNGAHVYLGTAAHCVNQRPDDLEAATITNGCDTRNQPLEPGTVLVEVEGAEHPALLVYSSWWTMQQEDTTGEACEYNDFALLRLHPNDAAVAHPSLLTFGGPTQLSRSVSSGDVVYSFGASEAVPRPPQLDPRRGLISQTSDWTHNAWFVSPGIPGDSGSAVIQMDGAAMGVLVTVGTNGNGITDLGKAMEFAHAYGMKFTLLTAPLEPSFPPGQTTQGGITDSVLS